jgi:arylsulfatase
MDARRPAGPLNPRRPFLCFEYNTFIVMRTKIRSDNKLPSGRAKIQVSTEYAEAKPAGPLTITMTVNGDEFAHGTVPVSAPLAFSANDCLDIGLCLGGSVSLDYYDKAPFPFQRRHPQRQRPATPPNQQRALR